MMPDHLVAGAGAIGDKEAMISIEDACCIALTFPDGTIVVEQLAQFFHGIADVGTQHVLTIKLVVHLAHRALQKGHPTRMARAVPGVRTVLGVIKQRLEKRRLHAFKITLGFADDVARDEFGRVLKHVDETMQFTQDVVGQMARGFGLAVHINWHIQIFAPHLFNEVAQVQHRRIQIGTRGKFLIVNRQDEGTGSALLLGELT